MTEIADDPLIGIRILAGGGSFPAWMAGSYLGAAGPFGSFPGLMSLIDKSPTGLGRNDGTAVFRATPEGQKVFAGLLAGHAITTPWGDPLPVLSAADYPSLVGSSSSSPSTRTSSSSSMGIVVAGLALAAAALVGRRR